MTHEARMLPPKPINEDKLANFLAKACFWAGVSPLTLLNFLLVEFCVGMWFTYLTFLISLMQSCICCFAYQIYVLLTRFLSRPILFLTRPCVKTDFLSTKVLPMSPAYIKDSRMLWNHAFSTYFKGHDSFKKCGDFVGFNGSDLVVRIIVFRYVSNIELFIIKFINSFSSYYVIC